MWITCLLCGALIADLPAHATWHEVPEGDIVGPQTPPPAGAPPAATHDDGGS